jgi:hypothetical protein
MVRQLMKKTFRSVSFRSFNLDVFARYFSMFRFAAKEQPESVLR